MPPSSYPTLTVTSESLPLAQAFAISRGSRTHAAVVVCRLADDVTGAVGMGECVPYPRYGETVASVSAQIEACDAALTAGLDREGLQAAMPPGAARFALDSALWDLEAKRTGIPVWQRAGLPEPQPIITAYTISLDSAAEMAANAQRHAKRPVLKLKLSGDDDVERVAAVRRAAPDATLVVDANEAWSTAHYDAFTPQLATLGVAMIEQPFGADADSALIGRPRPVPVCADESCHDRSSLPQLAGKYDFINIKLDKTGGLTEALALKAAARAQGFRIMVGCMVGSSLAMAPAHLVAQDAEIADLDGPLLLAEDRAGGCVFDGSIMHPPTPGFWGAGFSKG